MRSSSVSSVVAFLLTVSTVSSGNAYLCIFCLSAIISHIFLMVPLPLTPLKSICLVIHLTQIQCSIISNIYLPTTIPNWKPTNPTTNFIGGTLTMLCISAQPLNNYFTNVVLEENKMWNTSPLFAIQMWKRKEIIKIDADIGKKWTWKWQYNMT